MLKSGNFKKYNPKNPYAKIAILAFLRSINDLIKFISPQRTLDAGCGEGFVINYLLNYNQGLFIKGLDYNEEYLKAARRLNPYTEFLLGNIYNMPFQDKAFDLVLCLEVLEHLDKVDEALSELRRIAKEYCILSVPREPYFTVCQFLSGKNILKLGRHPEHAHYFTKRKICALLEKYFKIAKIVTSSPWLIILGRI